MIDGLGFCVIYRARVHPEKEQQYRDAWSRLTGLFRAEHGSLGSRLHRGSDGLWYAYAQWPSAAARAAAFAAAGDPQASAAMADAIVEFFPEIVLDPVEDQLACIGER